MGEGIEALNQFLKLPFSQTAFLLNPLGRKTTTICLSLSICTESRVKGRREKEIEGGKKTLCGCLSLLMSGRGNTTFLPPTCSLSFPS